MPVLLRIPRAEQHDTTGCNIVDEVTGLVYQLILEGKAKLWDSRLKDIRITPSTLQSLEKSSGTSFTNPEVIYIYEHWDRDGEDLVSRTLGFMFVNSNSAGNEVSYGYVDYDELKTPFIRKRIAANPNINNDVSLAMMLHKKPFHYNIIQFGGKAITAGAESRRIKSEFVAGREFNKSVPVPDIQERDVEYIIDLRPKTDDEKTRKGNALLGEIEKFLKANEEVFFNMGGDRVRNYISGKGKIDVTRLRVSETWKKRNGIISFETLEITVYINDTAMAPVPFNKVLWWGVFIEEKSMYELFREKDFTLFITRINSTEIPGKDAYLYYKALMSAEWRQLTEYVKNY